jgi:hypothetical protein
MPTQNRINAAIPLSVSNSGTGVSSTTAYGVLCSGTSSTNPIQNAGTGTTGQVLTSNGTSLPSFQDNYDYILIKTTTLSNGDASVIFDNLSSTYRVYYVLVDALCNTNNIWHYSQVSDDNGATWKRITKLSSGINTEGHALAYGICITKQGTILKVSLVVGVVVILVVSSIVILRK